MGQETPKVSVVIPVYNAEQYLRQCLDSVVNQTLKDIEIICVDEGSTDGSLAILREYEAKDSRICVHTQPNINAGAARNHGLRYAKGDYLSLLDADDYFEADMLERAYDRAIDRSAEIVVFCCDQYYTETGEYKAFPWSVRSALLPPHDPFAGVEIPKDFFMAFIGRAWDKLILRSFVEEKGLRFQEQRTSEELYFTFFALAQARRISFLDQVLVHHSTGIKESLSSTMELSWDCFYHALVMLRKGLVDTGLYAHYEQDFINYVVHFTLWNINNLSWPAQERVFYMTKNYWAKDFGVVEHDESYFYNKSEYNKYLSVLNNQYEEAYPDSLPKVSVIMPSLNVAPYIRECMDSVVNQTLKEIQIICVDAGSTDGTLKVLEEYAARDTRITIIHSDKKSYGYQMNLGIDAARADYIGIVETDDYISPEMFNTLYTMAVSREYPDVVKSGYCSLIEGEGKTEFKKKFIINAKTGDIFPVSEHYDILGAHPSIWSCIYKRSFLEEHKIRFMEVPGAGWVDNPFLFQTLCEAEKICWVNEPLYYYRETRPGSSTEIRNCSIPIDRVNNILDYLNTTGRTSPQLERVLYKRAIYYIGMIYNNPFLSQKNRIDAKQMLKRFNADVVSDMTANAKAKYPEYFDNNSSVSKWSLRWFKKKLKGGIQCYHDNGLKYTIVHTCQKISNVISKNAKTTAATQRILDKKKKNLRVLFIASDNNHTSGAFISMTVLNAILRKKYGLETLVVLPRQGSGKKLLDQNTIPSIYIPSEDWVLPLAAERNEIVLEKIKKAKEINKEAAKRIQELIVREKIDIVHINTTYSYVGAAAAMITNTPFFWHLREFLEEDQGNTLWDRAAGNDLINKADKVIAISDSIYKKYAAIIDNHRLVRIYNGVDAEKFYMPEKEILRNDPVVFIMIGGFEYYKGQIEFAEACVLLSKSGYQNFVVHFIGTGNPEVQSKVEKIVSDGGISDQVMFLGYHQDVYNYLKMSDISFSCSRAEAFGRTTAEAMLSGNLVIGADTAGTRELLQDGKNGLLYRQGDPEDLCRKMIEALSNREKSRELAKAGRNYTHENFTADMNARKIYELYQTVLPSREKTAKHDYSSHKKRRIS